MPGPRPSANAPADGRSRDVLDTVVSGVFAAGLSLEAAVGLPGEADRHIGEALRCLDEVVRQVRDHVFAEQRQSDQANRPHPGRRVHAGGSADDAALLEYRMASLRQRVIQTASALQVAAAETASLLERREDLLGPPTRIDFPTEIKRWRVFADQAGRVAERLERLQNQ